MVDVGRHDWEGALAHCPAYSLSGNRKSLSAGRPRVVLTSCLLCDTEATDGAGRVASSMPAMFGNHGAVTWGLWLFQVANPMGQSNHFCL